MKKSPLLKQTNITQLTKQAFAEATEEEKQFQPKWTDWIQIFSPWVRADEMQKYDELGYDLIMYSEDGKITEFRYKKRTSTINDILWESTNR